MQHKQKIFFKKISSFVADLFFPELCFGCEQAGSLLCHSCRRKIPLLTSQKCYQCQQSTTRYGETCPQCSENPLDGIFSATCYHVPLIKKMVHAYKYKFVRNFDSILGEILLEALKKSSLPLPTHILPVPLHSRRLRFRGFNQSELLGVFLETHFLGTLGKLFPHFLERQLATKSQQKTVSKTERQENLRDSFKVMNSHSLRGATVWLVDDVATTGSTLLECARILKDAGAQKVYGVVIARD